MVSGSDDGTMKVWSVSTGRQKEEYSSSKQKVDKYSIAFKKDLLLISEDQSVVAFFRAPDEISAMGRAGEMICVGCKHGEVLQLRAHWLV